MLYVVLLLGIKSPKEGLMGMACVFPCTHIQASGCCNQKISGTWPIFKHHSSCIQQIGLHSVRWRTCSR
jgi:hypothetical protein